MNRFKPYSPILYQFWKIGKTIRRPTRQHYVPYALPKLITYTNHFFCKYNDVIQVPEYPLDSWYQYQKASTVWWHTGIGILSILALSALEFAYCRRP